MADNSNNIKEEKSPLRGDLEGLLESRNTKPGGGVEV